MSKKNDTPIAPDEALGKAEVFVLKYKKTFIAVILIIILVAALKAFGVFDSKSKESTAGNQEIVYSEYKTFDADFEAALNGDDFNIGLLEIIEKYDGTTAANKANLYVGIVYAQQKQYEEAIKFLSAYEGNDNIIAAKAKQTLGNCYSHLNDYDKAISLVLEAADMADNIAVTPACWRDAAAMYEAQGDIEEAMELYNRIKDEYPNSPVANEANIKINAAK
jgi:tetratricopeptide (TPR) repeat protein